jgi:glycosyltransferase involved in cell wall biosynthesis
MNKINLSDIKLSVVVTVFSETFSINETIKRLLEHDRGYILEIILLTSPRASKETLDIARAAALKNSKVKVVMQQNNPGIGWAYREGMDAALGNYIVLMAADLETEPEAVDRMVKKIEETGCDEVIANRWLKGGGFTGYEPLKLVLNWFFQKIFKILFWTELGDLTFGFKILSRELAKKINWQGVRHEICIETTVKPLKAGYYIEQVASVWVGRREGTSVNKLLANFRYVIMALKVLLEPKKELFR